jgi:two-component system, OmpR family, alkaline phosphatase synthesis response regulator PhoP
MNKLQQRILILVVEDEKILTKIIEERLVSDGFEVIIANDGVEGLELARTKHPDLILLDLLLPKMSGMSVLRKLRAENDWGKKVPVVILTNLTSADEERNKEIAELMPAYYFLKTEKTLGEIIERIKECLKIN